MDGISVRPKGEWFLIPEEQESGLAALGGDYSFDSLVWAYSKGFFPWYKSDGLIHWFSPNPRFVITKDSFKVPKSLKPVLNSNRFNVSHNEDFLTVMQECKSAPRPGQDSSWILPEMVKGYHELFIRGFAWSSEAFFNHNLVGGLYGVKIGKVFSGESMFSKTTNASKTAFAKFAELFFEEGGQVIDCQVPSELFSNFGAKLIPRLDFEKSLEKAFS